MAKIDLADGYYRIPLSAHAALTLAVVLPNDMDPEPLIGIPLSLPMGWRDSPTYFCAFTETCADLCNAMTPSPISHPYDIPQPTHNTTSFAPSVIWPYNPWPPTHPLTHTDVYLDDFMLLTQPPSHLQAMDNLLGHLHSVFQDPADSPRRIVISQSKVQKGDAILSTQKRLLGWDNDSEKMEIRLPPHGIDRLCDLLLTFTQGKHTTWKKWQKLLGELRSMMLAIHKAQYFFTALQYPLVASHSRRFRIPALARQALYNWTNLLHHLELHPVPIAMIVPHAPHFFAASDASLHGLGGFWMPSNISRDKQPYVWRHALPADIQHRFLSPDNPTGDITINDLELAAAYLGHATPLCNTRPLPHTSTCLATDNMPMAAWLTKGSTSSAGPPAYLLRHLAHDCRSHNCSMTAVFTPSSTNNIADFLSRSFSLSDHELLESLQRLTPTQPPWKLVTPPEPSIYLMNWAL
jgi:hypothetical protein